MYAKKAHIDLQVHPFDNSLPDIVAAMHKTGLDMVGLSALDRSIFPEMIKQAQQHYPGSVIDDSGIILPNDRVIFNSREYSTGSGFQILTVGHSFETGIHDRPETIISESLRNDALVVMDNPYADNEYTRTAGHIDKKKEAKLESLCRRYSGDIALEWNSCAKPWMRAVLRGVLNTFSHETNYHDINKKVEELSEKLASHDYNVPIVTDTDLHARSRGLLDAMGTARMVVEVEGETAAELVKSMKSEIFANRHKNVKEYVSMMHLLRAYCFPVILPKLFPKPRG